MTDPDPRLEALRARLSGTRQAAAGTITTAIQIGTRFLAWVNKDTVTPEDVDRYFAYRRGAGIGERTMKTEFYNIRNLFEANHLDWPFDHRDTPQPKGEPNQPTLTEDQITTLILSQAKYKASDRLYLAIATTWACRSSALSLLSKRNWDGETLIIQGTHGSETVRHLIPDCVKPLFTAAATRPWETAGLRARHRGSMDLMFHRILTAAGLDPGPGHGWHSIRRTVTTMVLDVLPYDQSIAWAYSTGWKKDQIGKVFFHSRMAGVYNHPEILKDPYLRDKQIYAVHPLLPLWEKTLRESPPPVVAVTSESFQVQTSELSKPADIISKIIPVSTIPEAEGPVEQIKESPLDKLIRELKGG